MYNKIIIVGFSICVVIISGLGGALAIEDPYIGVAMMVFATLIIVFVLWNVLDSQYAPVTYTHEEHNINRVESSGFVFGWADRIPRKGDRTIMPDGSYIFVQAKSGGSGNLFLGEIERE